MASAKATEFLTRQLLVQKDIVTFRWLSRELGIHVNEAKNELAAFYASSRATDEPVYATFLLTGDAAPPKGDDNEMDVDETTTEKIAVRKIMLVGEDEIESAKIQFVQPPFMHVYSLSPTAIKDAALLTTISDRVRLKDATKGRAFHEAVGMVVGSDVKIDSNKSSLTEMTVDSRPAATSFEASTSTKKDNTKVAEKAKAPEKPKVEEKKKAGTLDWSRAKPKLTEGSKKTEAVELDSKANSRTSAKKEDVKVKDRNKAVKETVPKKAEDIKRGKKRPSNVMLSESEDEAPSPMTKQAVVSKSPERKPAKGKKNTVVSDAEEGAKAVKDTQSLKKGKGRVILSDEEDGAPPSLKAMMDLDDGQPLKQEDEDVEMQDEDDVVPIVKPKAKRKPKKVIPLGKNGLPKKRVVKNRKTKNARGYTITEDYSSYESVSDSEQVPPEEEEPKGKKASRKVKQEETTNPEDNELAKSDNKKPRESLSSSSKGIMASGKKSKDIMNYFVKKP